MGTSGKLVASRGCDLVTGTDAFPARNGHIYLFVSADATTQIAAFNEIPNTVVDDGWRGGNDSDAETINDRTYCSVALAVDTMIWFDGPVTSITLSAGSGWVYYN